MMAGLAHMVFVAALAGIAAPPSSPLPAGTRLRVTAAKTLTLPGLIHSEQRGGFSWVTVNRNRLRKGSDQATLFEAEGGEPLYVPHPGRRVTGTLVGESDEALLLRLDGSQEVVRIPRAALVRVEVSAGRPSRILQSLGGAALGAGALGSVLAVVNSRTYPSRPDFSRCERGDWMCGIAAELAWELRRPDPEGAFVTGAVLGAMLGGVIGAVEVHERWRPTERVKLGLMPAPSGRGAGLSVAVRF